MGSPLGVLFTNFYMGTIEEKVFSQFRKPAVYCRHVDDTFVLINNETELKHLKENFQQKSNLSFTTEASSDGALTFLYVLIKINNGNFTTTVYRKPTNDGNYLNGDSECPDSYLQTTIGAFARRAISHCSSYAETHNEIERVTQLLIDNGYKNSIVQK